MSATTEVVNSDDGARLVHDDDIEVDDSNGDETGPARTLGWITGVACPVSLSMFSTLLFLRVGYIVGNAGWLGGILLLLLAYAILLLTVFSISAIATNGQVRAGGVYFMISRTMGLEIGAAIGVLFFLANVVGSALFATGVAEGLFNSLGPRGQLVPGLLPYGYHLLYCFVTMAVNFVICIFGAKYFGRFSILMLFLVLACAGFVSVSFSLPSDVVKGYNLTEPNCTVNCTYDMHYGHFNGFGRTNASRVLNLTRDNLFFDFQQDCSDPDKHVGFSSVFAVLFSGVTGIMAGANLSGDLKEPSKAIPLGTHAGLLFTFAIYFMLFILTGLTCDRTLLYNDCHFMADLGIAGVGRVGGIVVLVGTLLTCWCASCSCLIGSSRIMQAVLDDVGGSGRLFKMVNAKTKSGNPVGAVITSTLLVCCFLFVQSLNEIAKLCSIFFLLSYFGVNASCLCLDWAAAPNFRPTFKVFHWSLALIGMVLTFSMTWVVDVRFAGASWFAFVILLVVFFLFRERFDQNWGHIGQAILFHQVRKYLLVLDPRLDHVKYWRPQVILFVSDPRNSCSVIDFVNALKKGGLYIIGHVYERDFDSCEADPAEEGKRNWMALIDWLRVKAFPELTVARSAREGVQHMTRLSGVGAMKPNTVVLGFPRIEEPELDDFRRGDSQYASEDLDSRFPRSSVRQEDSDKRKEEEFVAMIGDVLKMRRSLCVHRNFQRLRHSDWFDRLPFDHYKRKAAKPVFLDVWLVDFFAEPDNVNNDAGCLFVLQMACVVHMVRKYSGCTVRTLIRVPTAGGEHVAAAEALKSEAQRTLTEARIDSLIEPVLLDAGDLTPKSYDLKNLSEEYMQRMNDRIRELSSDTIVSFIFLGRPPPTTASAASTAGSAEKYVRLLDILTRDLPPLMLMHGMDSVVVC